MCCTSSPAKLSKTILYGAEIKESDKIYHVLGYKNTMGMHGLAEWQVFWNAWSLSLGLKYYNVTYDLESVTQNGQTVPKQYWYMLEIPEFYSINGSGIDMFWNVSLHF